MIFTLTLRIGELLVIVTTIGVGRIGVTYELLMTPLFMIAVVVSTISTSKFPTNGFTFYGLEIFDI